MITVRRSDHKTTLFSLALQLRLVWSHQSGGVTHLQSSARGKIDFHTEDTQTTLWAPTQGDSKATDLGPQDLWSTEPVDPTLDDPEASRAGSFPVFIHSEAPIQIAVFRGEIVYLKRKNTVRAHRAVVLSTHLQLLIKQLLNDISDLSSAPGTTLKSSVCLSLCYLTSGDICIGPPQVLPLLSLFREPRLKYLSFTCRTNSLVTLSKNVSYLAGSSIPPWTRVHLMAGVGTPLTTPLKMAFLPLKRGKKFVISDRFEHKDCHSRPLMLSIE